jgi:hypothetical protein
MSSESALERQERIAIGVSHAARFDWDKAALETCQSYVETVSV